MSKDIEIRDCVKQLKPLLITKAELKVLLNIKADSHFFQLEKENKIPKAVKLFAQKKLYRLSDVEKFIAELPVED